MKANRFLTLTEKQQLSPSIVRLVFIGDELNSFPVDQESGYVKLLFAAEGQQSVDGQQLDDKAYFKNLHKRTFTIRDFNPDTNNLHIDGICHSFGHPDQGPANAWLESVEVGHQIWVSGPGDKKIIYPFADWFFLIGDMTALPAIAVNLAQLPTDARGYAVIEVIDQADITDLAKPDNVQLHWVVNPSPKTANTLLADAARALPWQKGTPAVWAAGEFELMRAMRRYFKNDCSVPKENIYASSYWKIGVNDEGNKQAKKLDEMSEEA